jgi:hypothetical protein
MKNIRTFGIIVLMAPSMLESYWELGSISGTKTGVVDWFQVMVIFFVFAMPVKIFLVALSVMSVKSDTRWRKIVAYLGLAVGGLGILLSLVYFGLGAYHYYS